MPRCASPWKSAYMRQYLIENNWLHKSVNDPIIMRGHDDHVITCLQFYGNRILSGSDDTTLKVWSAVTGTVRVYNIIIIIIIINIRDLFAITTFHICTSSSNKQCNIIIHIIQIKSVLIMKICLLFIILECHRSRSLLLVTNNHVLF